MMVSRMKYLINYCMHIQIKLNFLIASYFMFYKRYLVINLNFHSKYERTNYLNPPLIANVNSNLNIEY